MTTEQRPREWWITLHKNEFDAIVPFHAFTSRDKAFNERAHEHVHVIEHSAYEELRKERDELHERLNTVNETNTLKQMTIHELQRQRDTLKAELAEVQATIVRWHANHDAYFIERADKQDRKLATAKAALRRIEMQNLDGLADCPGIAREALGEMG